MEYLELGQSKLAVSRLCFGTLTMGPLQANLSLRDGRDLLLAAFGAGINFLDTAELYGTYPYIKEALAALPTRGGRPQSEDIIIASKSYAYTYEGMAKSIADAALAIGRKIDIFLLHEQPSRLTLKGHAAALRCLIDAKRAGELKAIGVSTHHI